MELRGPPGHSRRRPQPVPGAPPALRCPCAPRLVARRNRRMKRRRLSF